MRKYFIFMSITSMVIEGHKSPSNFSVNPTLPLFEGLLMLVWISISLSQSCSLFPSLSLTLSLCPSLLPPSFAPCKHSSTHREIFL